MARKRAIRPDDVLPLWVLALVDDDGGRRISRSSIRKRVSRVPAGWRRRDRRGSRRYRAGVARRISAAPSIPTARRGSFAPIHRAALARFWIDDLFEAAYRVVLLGFSRVTGWVDRYIVDGVVNALSAWTLTTGDDLRLMQTGRAQDYVYGVAVGLAVLLLWVRWLTA